MLQKKRSHNGSYQRTVRTTEIEKLDFAACLREVSLGRVRDYQMSRALALTLVLCAFLKWDYVSVLGQNSGAVPPEAQALFEGVEKSVQLIAESALLNYRNRRGSWRNCSSNGRCSVFSCKSLKLEASNLECLAFPGGRTCQGVGSNSLGCKNATFSTSSYVRLPPNSNDPGRLTCDAQMTICSQADLDSQAFVKVYPNHGVPFDKIAWSMFGASNGIFRRYPGQEDPPDICKAHNYDPRKRSWYKAVTGVSKQVIVMIDVGGPMANPLSIALGPIQIVTAAQRILTEFLDTLNTDDVVWVYSFDNVGPKLVGNKVNIPADEEDNGTTLAPLKQAINDIQVTTAVEAANLTAALESVLLMEGFDTSLAKSLKVLLILTVGDLAEGPSGSISSNSSIAQFVTTNEVRTFVYHLNDSSSEADVSRLTDLKAVACAIGGVYNSVPLANILDDPVSAVQSFYSYVANLRFGLDSEKPLWVPSYSAASGIGQVMSVAYPVFDGSILIGVANIDLLRDEVEAQWRGAIDNWRKAADKKHDAGSPLNCSVSLMPDAADCSGDQIPDGGLCLSKSFTFAGPATARDYAERTCCEGFCTANKGESSLTIILLASVIPASVVFIIAVYWLSRWYKVGLPPAEGKDDAIGQLPGDLKLDDVPQGQRANDSAERTFGGHVL